MQFSYSIFYTNRSSPESKFSLRLLYTAVGWAFCYPAVACLIALVISSGQASIA